MLKCRFLGLHSPASQSGAEMKSEVLLSHVQLFATSWTAASQAPLSMGFSRQEYCFLLQGIFPTQGLNPGYQDCRRTFYPLSHQGSRSLYFTHTHLGVSVVVESCLTLCDPWTAARQAPLSFTISWRLLKLLSIESVMLPLLLLPSIFPSISFEDHYPSCPGRWQGEVTIEVVAF